MRFSLIEKCALLFLFEAIILSPYISSWFPKLFGIPIGPVLRGGGILFFYIVFCMPIILGRVSVKIGYGIFISIVTFLILIVVSAFNGISSPLQIVIGLHAFIFYPFIFMVLYFSSKKYSLYDTVKFTSFISSLVYFNMLIMAIIAIVDVASSGEFTLLLGYDPHYAGDGFSLVNRYYDTVRANGGFADALAFGYLMAIGITFALYMMSHKFSENNKIKYMLLLILCGIALFLTITRGAIFAGCVAIFIFVIRKTRNILLLFLVVTFSLPFVSGKYIDIFAGRFSDSDPGSKQSTTLRYEMAVDSLEYLYANPLGVGIGTQGGGNILSEKDNRINTDNFIFHALLELGVLGGVIFYIILFYQFKIVYKSSGLTSFFCMLAIFLISILVSSSMQSGVLSATFWLVMFIFTLNVGSGKNVRVA